MSPFQCPKCRTKVPAGWQTCRICGAALPKTTGAPSLAGSPEYPTLKGPEAVDAVGELVWKTSGSRVVRSIAIGVGIFALVVLPLWLWNQGYIASHGASLFSNGNDATDVRFHDQAAADRLTADGKEVHAGLEQLNNLLKQDTGDLDKSRDQVPVLLAAVDHFEQALHRLQADTQQAIDSKAYASKKDRRKLENVLKIVHIRQTSCAVYRRISERIVDSKDEQWTKDTRGAYYLSSLKEYVDDLNSEIFYENDQAAQLANNLGEETPNSQAPAVFESGYFSESYGVGTPNPWTKEPAKSTLLSLGFVLTSDGEAVMKLSTLLDKPRVQIRLADGRLFTVVSIVGYDIDHDLAIVRLGRPMGEPANWPEDLPAYALEVEGVPRPAGPIGIQLKKDWVKVDQAPNFSAPASDMFGLSYALDTRKEALTFHDCGAPVLNAEKQVIGVLCGKSPYWPPQTKLPKLPLPTPVVASTLLRSLQNVDVSKYPEELMYSLKRDSPEAFATQSVPQ